MALPHAAVPLLRPSHLRRGDAASADRGDQKLAGAGLRLRLRAPDYAAVHGQAGRRRGEQAWREQEGREVRCGGGA